MRRVGDTAPGPDGLAHRTWAVGRGPVVVMEAFWALTAGQSLPRAVPESPTAFLAKGDKPEDAEAVTLTRSADETRPLSLKNTLNKKRDGHRSNHT